MVVAVVRCLLASGVPIPRVFGGVCLPTQGRRAFNKRLVIGAACCSHVTPEWRDSGLLSLFVPVCPATSSASAGEKTRRPERIHGMSSCFYHARWQRAHVRWTRGNGMQKHATATEPSPRRRSGGLDLAPGRKSSPVNPKADGSSRVVTGVANYWMDCSILARRPMAIEVCWVPDGHAGGRSSLEAEDEFGDMPVAACTSDRVSMQHRWPLVANASVAVAKLAGNPIHETFTCMAKQPELLPRISRQQGEGAGH